MNDLVATRDPDPDREEHVRHILAYHHHSKHHLHRYAEGPGHLDWANQPDPFRTYAGAPAVDLPLLADAIVASYGDLYRPGAVAPRRPALDTVAILLELALGLSAWKEYQGSRWALRCNPSSGNLHPTEGYAVLPPLPGLEAGVYHYVSRDHRLERRRHLSAAAVSALTECLPAPSFVIGLSSVHWREAWKYGVRAYRYCQHDAGHALAAVRYAAAALGWSARLLDTPGDAEVAVLLGLDRNEDFAGLDALDREHPDTLLIVGPPPLPVGAVDIAAVRGGTWAGEANPLSRAPRPLEADRPRRERGLEAADCVGAPLATRRPCRRWPPWRQAVQDRCQPRRSSANGAAPWASTGGPASMPSACTTCWITCCRGPACRPGTCCRGGPTCTRRCSFTGSAAWRPACTSSSVTPRPTKPCGPPADRPSSGGTPLTVPTICPCIFLRRATLRQTARTVSCHQEIAADGAFSLGMIAEFGDVIRDRGPWWYRRLFWEAGVLGQVLYLEAEAAGVRGTGIGCYFDDAMHEVLGLAGDRFQSLYHFTVGGPVEDGRSAHVPP